MIPSNETPQHGNGQTPRVPGALAGKIWVSPDFDEPLAEFEDDR